ncbi:unnamed protein product [Cuscuta campestris]|uniref:Peptidase A1 domain-containing protein n=1 Tax=Cuscuta campestris TaxID=132261 RepID=A0A484LP87_9ASTE|nr:unnamed protein product [Cuscuta campestris]
MIRRMVNVGSYYNNYMFPSLPLLLLAFCLATPLLLPPAAAVATTLFDVESSLQETLHVGQPPGERGSYDEVVVEEDDRRHHDTNKQSFPPPPPPSSSGYSVVLQPRSAVFPTSYPDYRSLTLARLKRDSARAKWIQDRLDLAAGRTEEIPEEVPSSSEVTPGAGSGSHEYFALVGIGGAKFHLALDTGSELTWLQCSPCDQCYPQTDPIFVPSQSPTYSPLPCHADNCPSPTHFSSQCGWNHTCRYRTVYGDTSTSEGDLAKESVTLGDGLVPLPNITIGCGRNNPGMLAGGPAGIMGLNGGSLSFTTQIGATSFSYCLVDKDDTTHSSTLDFFVKVDDGAVVAPLMKTGGFYQIGLAGISVGDAPMTDITGAVIVDSGTVVSQLPGDAYNSVREALVANVNLTSRPQVGPMDTCFDMSGVDITMAVPPVSFHFKNGQELKLPAKNYMTPVDSSGTHCLAFAAATTPNSIIGNVQQQGIRVTYDLAGSVFRFNPGNC